MWDINDNAVSFIFLRILRSILIRFTKGLHQSESPLPWTSVTSACHTSLRVSTCIQDAFTSNLSDFAIVLYYWWQSHEVACMMWDINDNAVSFISPKMLRNYIRPLSKGITMQSSTCVASVWHTTLNVSTFNILYKQHVWFWYRPVQVLLMTVALLCHQLC